MVKAIGDSVLTLQTPSTPNGRGRLAGTPNSLSEHQNLQLPSSRLRDLAGMSSALPHAFQHFPEHTQRNYIQVETYDSIIAPPSANSGYPANIGGGQHRRSDSMDADSRKGMPDADHTKPGPNQRRSRSTAPNQRPNPHSGSAYPSTQENAPSHAPTDFRPSSASFSPPTAPYSQRSGYGGPQYTIPPPQPAASMAMSHPPSPYPYAHTFHHPDGTMVSPNVHANYQQMMQTHAPPPVFPYQRQHAENMPGGHTSYPSTRNPTLYAPHASSAPTTPHLSSPRPRITPPFLGNSQYHALPYAATMSMPAYQYSAPAYPSPSMYQSPYPSPGFGQHYQPQNADAEPQGAWYYFAQLASPQQYDPVPPYHQGGHYSIGYPHGGHSGLDTPYSPGPSQLGPPVGQAPTNRPSGSNPPSFAPYPEERPSMESPGPAGIGPLPDHHVQSVDEAAEAASSGGGGSVRQMATDKPSQRRSYHPNPPAHRSEWVMWAGNVPSGASHDELWRFFTAPPDEQSGDDLNGVLSIFLISRSSCAFVNYSSEEHLQQAIKRFDGMALRPNDPRCPRLVCRVRGKGDDLKAGVGYQRGMGMHTKWLREQKGKSKELSADASEVSTSDGHVSSPGSFSDNLTRAMSAVSISSGDEESKHMRPPSHSNSSGSYASTTSSFLTKYFPKRYFILKSLTQEDLDLSVQRGIWATQKHNEEILDQAFRTSQEVYLIFGVNKSREFYGYARMTSPVKREGQQDVQWAARPPPHSSLVTRSLHSSPPPIQALPFFSPSDQRLVDNSPLAMGGPATQAAKPPGPSSLRHSAPPLLGKQYHKPTIESPKAKPHSLDQRSIYNQIPSESFELDESAPARAMRANHGLPPDGPQLESSGPSRGPPALHAVAEEGPGDEMHQYGKAVIQQPEDVQRGEVSWGDSFSVEWLCTTRFPFAQTRHLRNPWNRGKEIKVSRDGTELEPTVGEQLLREWPTSGT